MKLTEARVDKPAPKGPPQAFDLEARCNTVGCHAKVELGPGDLARADDSVSYVCPACGQDNTIAITDIKPELHNHLPNKK